MLPDRRLPLLLALCALLLAGCQGGLGLGSEEEEDAEARVAYYEEAAKTYYDGGRYESAVQMWDRVLAERPDDQWAKFGLAKSLQMIATPASLRRAEDVLLEIVNLDWSHPTRGDVRFEVQTTLATVYSSLADFYDRDVRMLENRLANDPNADAAELRGWLQRQRNERDDLLRRSIPLYRQVLRQSPDNPHALAGLAKAHLVAGDEELGIGFAERYVEISRTSRLRWRQQLEEYERLRQGRVSADQRASYLQKIHGAKEKELGMRLLLGSVFMRREEFARAVEAYEAVIDLDPALPAAYVERAQAYAALGLYEPAISDLEEYLKLTDPQRHREGRLSAAELLERYRGIAARRGGSAGRPPAAPPPRPIEEEDLPFGSPDG